MIKFNLNFQLNRFPCRLGTVPFALSWPLTLARQGMPLLHRPGKPCALDLDSFRKRGWTRSGRNECQQQGNVARCVCVGGANVENKKSEQLRFSQSDALMCIMIFSWDLKRIINNKNTWRTIEGAAKNVGVRLSPELGRRLSLRY